MNGTSGIWLLHDIKEDHDQEANHVNQRNSFQDSLSRKKKLYLTNSDYHDDMIHSASSPVTPRGIQAEDKPSSNPREYVSCYIHNFLIFTIVADVILSFM